MRYTVIAFMTHSTQLRGPNMSQGAWRSAAAIGVSLGAMLAATGDLLLLAALPFLVALDWATRQRRALSRRPPHGAWTGPAVCETAGGCGDTRGPRRVCVPAPPSPASVGG